MTIVNRQALIAGSQKYSAAKKQVEAWFAEVEKARWRGPIDINRGTPARVLLLTTLLFLTSREINIGLS